MTAIAVLPAHGLALRLRLLGRAVVVMITSVPVGTGLFCVWVTFALLSPLTLLVWTVPPLTALVRSYANAYRRDTERFAGGPVRAPYREVRGGLFARVTTILRDPASWRDALWLLVHTVVGSVLAAVPVGLFLGGLFYLVFPFLYWVTPQQAFGRPFGFFEIHSVVAAAALMPLALVCFALWYALTVPLARGEARLTRAMLSA